MRLEIISVGRGSDQKGKELIIFKGRNGHGVSELVVVPNSPELARIPRGTLIERHPTGLDTRQIDILDVNGAVLKSIQL